MMNHAIQDDISILLNLHSAVNSDAFRMAFSISKIDDTPIGTFFSDEIFSSKKGVTSEILLTIKNHQLAKGQYYLSFSVGVGNEVIGITDYDVVLETLFFEIMYADSDKEKMISLWSSNWGSVNFQNVNLKQF